MFAIVAPALAGGCQGGAGGPPAPTARVAPAKPREADRVIVVKSKRVLELVSGRKVFARYPIALGPHPLGPKHQAGDGRTPEGVYLIDWRSADTRYYRELHISYPNAGDRARARSMGVNPGGAIFIHGLPPGYDGFDPIRFYRDWTEGCIAVSDVAIRKIWNAVPNGTVIDIRP